MGRERSRPIFVGKVYAIWCGDAGLAIENFRDKRVGEE
jgi:hypothetical protein